MISKIQLWSKYGPRIALGNPMEPEEIVESVINSSNQSKGSVLAVLAELDVYILAGLKAGRIVRLPNGIRFEPVARKDGSIRIVISIDKEMEHNVNAFFKGKWINANHIGWTEAQMAELWNEDHPERPILPD
jgi:hypothetical protein